MILESQSVTLISYPNFLLHLFLRCPSTHAACQINFVTVVYLSALHIQIICICIIIYLMIWCMNSCYFFLTHSVLITSSALQSTCGKEYITVHEVTAAYLVSSLVGECILKPIFSSRLRGSLNQVQCLYLNGSARFSTFSKCSFCASILSL